MVSGRPARAGLAGRVRSFADALRGVATLLRAEPNAWIHAAATVAVLALALALGVDRRDGALLALAVGGVWSAEALNTALEALCDRLAPEPHPLVARAKDVAAAAVLLMAVAAAVVGLLVLGPPLWARWLG